MKQVTLVSQIQEVRSSTYTGMESLRAAILEIVYHNLLYIKIKSGNNLWTGKAKSKETLSLCLEEGICFSKSIGALFLYLTFQGTFLGYVLGQNVEESGKNPLTSS